MWILVCQANSCSQEGNQATQNRAKEFSVGVKRFRVVLKEIWENNSPSERIEEAWRPRQVQTSQ